MPSTLLRWGLLFVSGVFIPLAEMGPLARGIAYLSPLTYAQDLMNHALVSSGLINPLLDLGVLTVSIFIFLAPSVWMHKRAKVLGY
jgi:ABC-2 type transport system permease protein